MKYPGSGTRIRRMIIHLAWLCTIFPLSRRLASLIPNGTYEWTVLTAWFFMLIGIGAFYSWIFKCYDWFNNKK